MPRRLSDAEVEALLAADVPCRLATLDAQGVPRVTPLWFVWADGAFWMTSIDDRLHLRDLARDPRAGICVDTEEGTSRDGVRANRQVSARGRAECFRETDGAWTRRITLKYVPGPDGPRQAEVRAGHSRLVIRLEPERLVALGAP